MAARPCTQRAVAALIAVSGAFAAAASPAFGHAAYLGSSPEAGARLPQPPAQVTLTFSEALNGKLTRAALATARGGTTITAVASVAGRRLLLRPKRPLSRGVYSVRWHSVSTDDGHALEGTFSFGVRASAAGGEHSTSLSPLARDGWIRVLARAVMYAVLLVFVGALLLRALLAGSGRSWLVPHGVTADPAMQADRVAQRERLLLSDLGFFAAAAAAISALADASDAAGGLSLTGVRDYLLSSSAGQGRLAVVVLLLLAGWAARGYPRAAALPAASALGALAASGHANSASAGLLAVGVDWLHLLAAAAWLGGIALIAVVWGPALRRGPARTRLALARDVLPVFGRVALPAFGLVVATGGASALIELGSIAALWQTDYGRVLLVKMGLVGLVALLSYVHALRLRPRLLGGPAPDMRTERQHWRLLRTEPFVGLGVVAAVAVLVAFPLPPRQLRADDEARAAAAAAPCDPCVLPQPRANELAVAEQGGSDVVAGWLRREGSEVSGTVRVYGLNGKPSRDAFVVEGANTSDCGFGCKRFANAPAPERLTVFLTQRGRTYIARLPTRWLPRNSATARRLLERAQEKMRSLDSVREHERASSVPGLSAITDYRLESPNRFALRTDRGLESIAIGKDQWLRPGPGQAWTKRAYGGGVPYRTRSWFRWTTYARHTYLLRRTRELAVVATMDPGTPAWWRFYIDRRTHRVIRSRLITNGHFMTQRYFAFNQPARIEPPVPGTR
jgi:copper transport protein